MDEGGVDAAVIHPPGWDPGSTDMAFAAVRNYPGRFAIMGSVPLDRPESRARIASWREQPGMLGLRYGFLADPARRWLHDGTIDWLWAAAEEAGVPIAALATDSLTELGRIAERHPGLRLTIDEAMAEADLAVNLDPNSVRALGSQGSARTFGGRPGEAIDPLKTAMRLSPRDPLRPF
jgi:predicted TIM-barrel fold metal-dependent hydrolase